MVHPSQKKSLFYVAIANIQENILSTINSQQSAPISDDMPDLAECSDSNDDDNDSVASIPISKRFNRTYRYPQLANPAVELSTISSHHSSLISKEDGDLPDLAE